MVAYPFVSWLLTSWWVCNVSSWQLFSGKLFVLNTVLLCGYHLFFSCWACILRLLGIWVYIGILFVQVVYDLCVGVAPHIVSSNIVALYVSL